MRALVLFGVVVSAAACQCGGSVLVKSGSDRPVGVLMSDAGVGGGAAGGSAGGQATAGGSAGGGNVGGGAGTAGGAPVPDWCASDCDCPAGQRCVATGFEIILNRCQPGGVNACVTPCAVMCPSGTQCVNGACVATPCTGPMCTTSHTTTINGRYQTYYELDISEFAQRASDIVKLLDLLRAISQGMTTNCNTLGGIEQQLICYVGNLVAQNVQAPPWVGQLFQVLSDMFRFGNRPLKARGVMDVVEGQLSRVAASEAWSELWLDYNGQVVNVMNNPMLGANGQITVTVLAFGGTRTAQEVILGPRLIEFDVNKLLVNLINVAIMAGSNNRARDVGELINLILCDQLGSVQTRLACGALAQQLADDFELGSGLGGLRFDEQRATIHDLDGNGTADALGLPQARGRVTGRMTNGFVSGALGPFPNSSWYGTK
ncbi:MAG: hypothetical protein JNJ54_11465 [Myxococcaceae bacterium]|nr:hypothetical protein [Myxococcaceae bacterium]